MKKFSILFASVAMLFGVGLGVGAAVSSDKSEPALEAKADSSIKTLYINQFDGGADKGGVWSNFKYYLFGTGGEKAAWPGEAFTDDMKTKTPNEYDQYQYVLDIDTSKYQSLVLSGNSDSTWGGAFAKTEDITIADLDGNGLYCGAHQGWQSDANVFKVGTYTYSTKTIYMLDLRGDVYNTYHYCHAYADGKSGTAWPGVEMTKVAGQNNLYSVEINSMLNNIVLNNSDKGGVKTEDISGVGADDAYVVYPDNGYNKLTLDAARFVDSYMKFETKWLDNEGDGSCKSAGWYSAAKSAFSGKTAEQKSAILAHEPTQYRLAAWAAANGESFNTSTGVFSSSGNYFTATDSNSTLLIVIIISAVSVASLAALLIIKKRKHN